MGNIVSLDQIPEQDGAEILLVDLDSQVPVKTNDLGKAPGLPVMLE
jgi:hypothetical protein